MSGGVTSVTIHPAGGSGYGVLHLVQGWWWCWFMCPPLVMHVVEVQIHCAAVFTLGVYCGQSSVRHLRYLAKLRVWHAGQRQSPG